MVHIDTFLAAFEAALTRTFGERVRFFGIQGSYARGEADEMSDIDPAVILDVLTPEDIARYCAMLDTLPERDKICGFLCGAAEFSAWDRADLFNFYFTTDPIIGSLDALIPPPTRGEALAAMHLGACNLCHGCVHSMCGGRSIRALTELYKSAVFVLQAAHFVRTGEFVRKHADLAALLPESEAQILRTAGMLRRGEPVEYGRAAAALYDFARAAIAEASR